MLSKTVWSIAAAGLCFIGYCIYYDRKRRSSPHFKETLREKRRKARQTARDRKKSLSLNLDDPQSMEELFMQEMHIGQSFLLKGDLERSVEHLGNAVLLCRNQSQFLQTLQQNLPEPVFQLLIARLPSAAARLEGKSQSAEEEEVEEEMF